MNLILTFVAVACFVSQSKGIDESTVEPATERLVYDRVPQLHELDSRSLLEFFYRVEFEELVKYAAKSHRFRGLATQTVLIRHQLNKKLVEFKPIASPVNKNFIFPDDDNMIIYRSGETLEFLSMFGHLISNVKFTYPSSAISQHLDSVQRTISYINYYCIELKELEIHNIQQDVFLIWEKQFQNVNDVKMQNGMWNCEEANVNLTEIFPSLHRLDMEDIWYSSSKCIDYHFPHLEHITFPMYNEEHEVLYENIFDLNPQIKSIHLTNVDNLDVLRLAIKKLHYIEAIKLSNMAPDIFDKIRSGEEIHFENAKRFAIHFNAVKQTESKLIPVKSDQLEEIDITWIGSNPISEEWMEFIRQQQRLRSLTILYGDALISFEQWISFIQRLPKLEVLRTHWSARHEDGGIVELMNKETKLKKIVFLDMTEEEYNVLMIVIDPEWQITGKVQPIMKEAIFIRKENTDDDK